MKRGRKQSRKRSEVNCEHTGPVLAYRHQSREWRSGINQLSECCYQAKQSSLPSLNGSIKSAGHIRERNFPFNSADSEIKGTLSVTSAKCNIPHQSGICSRFDSICFLGRLSADEIHFTNIAWRQSGLVRLKNKHIKVNLTSNQISKLFVQKVKKNWICVLAFLRCSQKTWVILVTDWSTTPSLIHLCLPWFFYGLQGVNTTEDSPPLPHSGLRNRNWSQRRRITWR